jgi:hypothetical protein
MTNYGEDFHGPAATSEVAEWRMAREAAPVRMSQSQMRDVRRALFEREWVVGGDSEPLWLIGFSHSLLIQIQILKLTLAIQNRGPHFVGGLMLGRTKG